MSLPARTNIRLVCPECGARLRVVKSVPAGKKVKCPRCSRRFEPAAPDDTKPNSGPAGLVVGQGGAEVAADPQDLGAGDPPMSPGRQADSLALARQVDALCDRCEEALRAGQAGDWWDWLPPAGPARGRALAELARLDLEHRLRAGEPVRVEAYLARCPELRQDAEAVLALITREHQVRRLAEPELTLADYDRRFPDLTRHLRPFDRPGAQGQAPPTLARGVPGLEGPWGAVSNTEAQSNTPQLP